MKIQISLKDFIQGSIEEAQAAHPPHIPPPAIVHNMKREDPETWYQKLHGKEIEKAYNLPFGILKHMIEIESKGDPFAVSRRGAKGLFQLMPAHISGFTGDPFNPVQAVNHVAQQLSKDIRDLGSVTLGLASYNWGRKHVINKGLQQAPAETLSFLDHFRNKGIIPRDPMFDDDGW